MRLRAGIWVPIACVLLASLIGWGAWATQTIEKKVPRSVFNEHMKDFNDHMRKNDERFERIQNRIEDKLDRVEDKLDNLQGGSS